MIELATQILKDTTDRLNDFDLDITSPRCVNEIMYAIGRIDTVIQILENSQKHTSPNPTPHE